MSSKYKSRDPDNLYFVTFAVINWIDLFIRCEYKDILLDSWKYCQAHKRLQLWAWCIMTSHVRMIISAEKNKPENVMRDMKRHTSEQLKEAIIKHPAESRWEWMLSMMYQAGKDNCHNSGFQLWQQGNHPVELTTLKIAHQRLYYTHYNPVVSGIVEKPEDYLYSGARDYVG